MSGNIHEMQTKTEDQRNDETSFGGFSSRFSYERCCRERMAKRSVRIASRVLSYLCMTILVASLGTLCGILMHEVVESNKGLYYPGAAPSVPADDTQKADAAPSEETVRGYSSLSDTAGSATEDVTAELSRRYRIPMGVMIKRLADNSAAASAGIEPGDIIVAVGETEVFTLEGMNALLESLEPGSAVTMTLFRNNAYIDVEVTFE